MDKKKCAAEQPRTWRTIGLGRLLALAIGSSMAAVKAGPVKQQGRGWNELGGEVSPDEEVETRVDQSFKKFHHEGTEEDVDVLTGGRGIEGGSVFKRVKMEEHGS